MCPFECTSEMSDSCGWDSCCELVRSLKEKPSQPESNDRVTDWLPRSWFDQAHNKLLNRLCIITKLEVEDSVSFALAIQ